MLRLLLLLALLASPAQATTVLGVTIDDLVAESELIFQGEVLASRGVEDASGHISTFITFKVIDVVAGRYDSGSLELEFMGGMANGRILVVDGLRLPAVGEVGTYFVESLSAKLINPLLGWSQGYIPHSTGHSSKVASISPAPMLPRTQAILDEQPDAATGVVSAYRTSGNYWSSGSAQFDIGIPGTAPSGIRWSQSLLDALNQWSEQTPFKFRPVNAYGDPCLSGSVGKGIATADFAATVCGQEFGSKVLAVTLVSGTCFTSDCRGGFDIRNAGTIFNANEQWDVYSGPRRAGVYDFGRVALHELGHVMGLDHERVLPAIMQANLTDSFTLQADDINGANAIYGIAPARDDQSFNVLPSIYGIDVVLPAGSDLTGFPQNIALTGALESSDGLLNARYLDIFQYTLTQDAQLDIRLESSQLAPMLYLVRVDSAQRPIPAETFIDGNSGGNPGASLLRTVPAGTYWIGASSASPSRRGAYTLSVSAGNGTPPTFDGYTSKYGIPVQINPNPFIAGALGSGDKRLGSGTPIDLYEFTVREPVTLQIDLGSRALDTMLYLARVKDNQDLDSAMYYEDNDGGGGTNSRLTRALSAGTYWIGASSVATDAAGAYQINISVLPF